MNCQNLKVEVQKYKTEWRYSPLLSLIMILLLFNREQSKIADELIEVTKKQNHQLN